MGLLTNATCWSASLAIPVTRPASTVASADPTDAFTGVTAGMDTSFVTRKAGSPANWPVPTFFRVTSAVVSTRPLGSRAQTAHTFPLAAARLGLDLGGTDEARAGQVNVRSLERQCLEAKVDRQVTGLGRVLVQSSST